MPRHSPTQGHAQPMVVPDRHSPGPDPRTQPDAPPTDAPRTGTSRAEPTSRRLTGSRPGDAAPTAFGAVRHAVSLVRETLPPLHPGGRPVIATVAAAAFGLRALRGRGTLGAIAATAGVAAFFRAPPRTTPRRVGVAVAPADGTVRDVADAEPPPELVAAGFPPGPSPRVSVFLSVYDVHVQRIPLDGQVRASEHRPGTYVSADLPAADANARTALWIHGTEGHDVASVQIAGLVARRILCDASPGDEVAAGEVYGLIRFGSRVDLQLPPGSRILVEPGQRTVGGETVLAELPAGAATPRSPGTSRNRTV